MSDVEVLVRAAGELEIDDRAGVDRWAHLSLCVLDAVFSIGARYTGVVRVCRRYADHAGLAVVTVPHRDAGTVVGTGAEQPLDVFVSHVRAVGVDGFAEDVVRNRCRTSPSGGIRKAEAALRYAETLVAHEVRTLGDVAALLASPARLGMVEGALRSVPGNGTGDLRLGYLWMLAGDDEQVKPDRMVLRWLARHLGRAVDVAQARDLIAATARRVGHTPWELDHAIWRARRAAGNVR